MPSIRLKLAVLPLLASVALSPVSGFAQDPGQKMPPTQVSVVTMEPQPLPIINELPGRVSATRTAEVRPRVNGIVLERVFEQGSLVKEGDVLYRIDPSQYKVAVASAEASLASAQASQLNARDQQARAEKLRERKVAAGVDLENADTNLAVAIANVGIAQATLDQARLNLAYTDVTAPITGVIGRALVTEGALVTAQTDIMATIQQLDPIYVDFTQSSSQVMQLRRAMQAGQLVATAPGEARVRLIFDDGSQYSEPGKLLFSEATVDPSTGQVTLRAEFPNAKDELLPGLYVRISIEQAVAKAALSVPQMAVQRDQQGNPFVYTVNNNKAERHDIVLGPSYGPRWIVLKGLAKGDQVIVEGAQKLYPDAEVAPEPWNDPEAAAAAVGETAAGDSTDATTDAEAVEQEIQQTDDQKAPANGAPAPATGDAAPAPAAGDAAPAKGQDPATPAPGKTE